MPSGTSAKARSNSPKKIPSKSLSRTKLPIQVPFPPMEALAAADVPQGPQWQYEPKWDGFRCLVFREGSNVTLQSKAGKPLTRYFPDVVTAVRALKAKQF